MIFARKSAPPSPASRPRHENRRTRANQWRARWAHMTKTRLQLFWAKVKIDHSGCWLWIGHVNKVNGYGQFWDGEKVIGAHVFSYRQFVGPIPPKHEPDHLCRVRHCVCPSHLEAVTRKENLLRGNTLTAKNSNKTFCSRGHPFSGENLFIAKNGSRQCRICRKYHDRKWRSENRARRQELDRMSYHRRKGKK